MQKQTKISKILCINSTSQTKEILALKAELMCTRKELIDTKEALNLSSSYERTFHNRYLHYMQKCDELEKENLELKAENKKLKLAIIQFKSVWNALTKKEA